MRFELNEMYNELARCPQRTAAELRFASPMRRTGFRREMLQQGSALLAPYPPEPKNLMSIADLRDFGSFHFLPLSFCLVLY